MVRHCLRGSYIAALVALLVADGDVAAHRGHGVGVLLRPQQRHLVALLAGDAHARRHLLGGLDHGVLRERVDVEVVPHRVLGLALSAGPVRVRVVDVGPVAGPIAAD